MVRNPKEPKMTAKPTAGQAVEIEGVHGTFTIKSVNRNRGRMTLANTRGGTGTAVLRRDGQWRIDTPVISNQRRVIFGES